MISSIKNKNKKIKKAIEGYSILTKTLSQKVFLVIDNKII